MIEIRYARPGETEAIRALWNHCFPGDELYREYFFTWLYKPEQALVALSDGRLAAMLHQIPQAFVAPDGGVMPARYLYAIGTHEEFRGRGLCGALLDQTFFDMHLRREGLATLVPASESLFRFYARFGFEPVFDCDEPATVDVSGMKAASPSDVTALAALYERHYGARVRLRRDEAWWHSLLRECRAFGQRIWLDDDSYAVVRANGSAREVVGPRWSNTTRKAYGMARVVDAAPVQRWLGVEPSGAIDRQCLWNTQAGSLLTERELAARLLNGAVMNAMHE